MNFDVEDGSPTILERGWTLEVGGWFSWGFCLECCVNFMGIYRKSEGRWSGSLPSLIIPYCFAESRIRNSLMKQVTPGRTFNKLIFQLNRNHQCWFFLWGNWHSWLDGEGFPWRFCSPKTTAFLVEVGFRDKMRDILHQRKHRRWQTKFVYDSPVLTIGTTNSSMHKM